MKLTKMSLVAALLVGSSAFAIDNVKISGDAKLFYSTDDSNGGDLLDKTTSFGQAALGLGLTADLDKNVKATVHMTALSTLGLENQLVVNVWEGTNGVDDYYWFDEAYLSANVAKTTVQIGRMKLATPLVYSEEWSIAANSFEAAVAVNKDLPDTTLVGAYVGASNGAAENGAPAIGKANVITAVNANGTSNFSQFYQGAFAAGLVNNSWKPLTVQAWYYNASHVATAYWVSADLSMNGILAGAQYTVTDLEGADAGQAAAVMAGYALKDVVTLKVAYSKVGSDNNAGFNLSGAGSSSLYTSGWWSTTLVSEKDTDAFSLSAEATVAGLDLGLYMVKATKGTKVDSSDSAHEETLTVSKSFGSLDTSVAVIHTNDYSAADAVNTVQAYLTYNF